MPQENTQYTKYRNTDIRGDIPFNDYGLGEQFKKSLHLLGLIRGMDLAAVQKGYTKMQDVTYKHSVSVANFMYDTAIQLGVDGGKAAQYYIAGLVHDIGKIEIDPKILNKPGRFTKSERNIMDQHAGLSLKYIPDFDQEIKNMVANHHMVRCQEGIYSSTTYPDIMYPVNDIPFDIQLISMCDIYDACASPRQYKNGFDLALSLSAFSDKVKDSHMINVFENNQIEMTSHQGVDINVKSNDLLFDFGQAIYPALRMKFFNTIHDIAENGNDTIPGFNVKVLSASDKNISLIISFQGRPILILGDNHSWDKILDENNNPKYDNLGMMQKKLSNPNPSVKWLIDETEINEMIKESEDREAGDIEI